jgi:hypothetical protein
MKFAANEYTITKSYSAALRNKRSSFLAETKTRKSAQTTLITTLGLRPNEYAQEIRFVLTLDDLFS